MVMVSGRAARWSERGYGHRGHNANGPPLTGNGAWGRRLCWSWATATGKNPPESQQSLFSWAGFPGLRRGRLWPRKRPSPGDAAARPSPRPCPSSSGRGTLDRRARGEAAAAVAMASPGRSMSAGFFCCPAAQQSAALYPPPSTRREKGRLPARSSMLPV